MVAFALLVLIVGMAEAGKIYYQPIEEKDFNICPDQISKCSGTSTCCQMESGQWGCCLFAQGTCCSDNLHCCPKGYSCNTLKGECVLAAYNHTIPWAKKQRASVSSTTIPAPADTICLDGTTCPGVATCCRNTRGLYSCCEAPLTVCCNFGRICCPADYVCEDETYCRPPFVNSFPSGGMKWLSIEDSK